MNNVLRVFCMIQNFATLDREEQLHQAAMYAIYYTIIGVGNSVLFALQVL